MEICTGQVAIGEIDIREIFPSAFGGTGLYARMQCPDDLGEGVWYAASWRIGRPLADFHLRRPRVELPERGDLRGWARELESASPAVELLPGLHGRELDECE
jgi:hypothetical protein